MEQDIRRFTQQSDSSASKSSEEEPATKVAKTSSKASPNRAFNDDWGIKFFVIQTAKTNLPHCLLCDETFSENKSNHLFRHYERNHLKKINEQYPSDSDARKKILLTTV